MATGNWGGLAVAGQDALMRILAQRDVEQQFRLREQAARQSTDESRYKRDRDSVTDAREEREFGERMKLNRAQLTSLDDQRKAVSTWREEQAAEKQRDAENETNQRRQMAEFITRVKANPQASREDRMLAVSFAHQLMTGKPAPADLLKDPNAEFTQFKQRADYNEGLRRSRPDKTKPDKSTRDDPKLPRGVRDYVLKLSQKHGDNYAAAQTELRNALPALTADHPNLDAGKTYDLLRKTVSRPSGQGNDLGGRVADILSKLPDE